ncbi:hypothetical protein [Kitasatospora sp. MBT66]|uniref:hypothetical protein n=1 Tax=Kitasatospora sp. MBT66 TaxID=1444769 RepID=UPI0005B921D1|nr:hypothetical protein [Kitasatospora sp. MBT66]
METQDELAMLLDSLAVGRRVCAGYGPAANVPIADRVFALAEQARHDRPVEHGTGPTSAAEVAAVLDPVNRWEAIEMMADMAAVDLVCSARLQDKDGAHRAAVRVAEILGEEADRVTNWEGFWASGGRWSPVTRHGIDVVVAGANDEFFAVLLAFGND